MWGVETLSIQGTSVAWIKLGRMILGISEQKYTAPVAAFAFLETPSEQTALPERLELYVVILSQRKSLK